MSAAGLPVSSFFFTSPLLRAARPVGAGRAGPLRGLRRALQVPGGHQLV